MNSLYVRSSHAVAAALGDGLAILDIRKDRYYSLNEVGAFLWERLNAPQSAETLAELVAQNYEVSVATALKDVATLLGNLSDEGLVESTSEAVAAANSCDS